MGIDLLFVRVAPIFLRAFLPVLVFSRHVERRNHFALRYLLSMIIGLALCYAVPHLLQTMFPEIHPSFASLLRMILVLILVNAGAFFCFSASVWTVMLISSSGYAVQDLVGHGKAIIMLLAGKTNPGASIIFNVIIESVLLLLVCGIILILFRDKAGKGEDYLDNRYKAILSFIVMLVCLGMGRLTNDNSSRNFMAQLAENLYAMLVSTMLLFIQYGSTSRAKLTHEVDAMREMMHLQRVQFDSNREHVQLVNEKYHDLSKMISTLSPHVPQEQIERMRTQISDYDAQTNTGNEALDVVLTEKRMYCNARGIGLTCMADGKALSVVDELDLYSLFSNLLSNAIEAVEKLPDNMERFIALTVSKDGNMVTIHAENPCAEAVVMTDGLPATTGDPLWHGFGMKSMERVAEKYGGTLVVTQQDSLFIVDILMFAPNPD